MAGYNEVLQKSNNALDAEERGLVRAGILAFHAAGRYRRLRKVKAEDVERVCAWCEMHHVGAKFKMVKFYRPDALNERHAFARLYAAMRRRLEKTNRSPQTFTNCTVKWLEWGGTLRRPIPTECEQVGATVTFKPNTKMVRVCFPDGREMRKFFNTNGFEILNADGKPVRYPF